MTPPDTLVARLTFVSFAFPLPFATLGHAVLIAFLASLSATPSVWSCLSVSLLSESAVGRVGKLERDPMSEEETTRWGELGHVGADPVRLPD